MEIFFILLLFFFIVITFTLYESRKFLILSICGFVLRLLLIFIETRYPIFGHGDLVDYVPFFDFYQDSTWSFFIQRTHVFFYTALYPGWIYSIFHFDSAIVVIKIFSAFFSILVLIPLNESIKYINNNVGINNFYANIITFWPTWLRYSIEVGRSSITCFFLISTVAVILSILSKYSLKKFVLLLLLTFMTVYLRIHYVAVLLPIFVYFIYVLLKPLPKIVSLLVFSVLSFAFFIFSYKFYFSNLGAYIDLNSVDGLTEFASRREEGGSVYLVGIYPSNILDLFWYLPIQAFYFMFSPMIFDVRSAFQLGSSIQALFIMFICIKIFLNKRIRYISKPIILMVLCAALAFGAVTKNAGGAERWRLPFVLIILSIGSCFKVRENE
ncbi:hypothetical protein [Photobacterium damselae]|uniref:hypothetical protein n=1 Tax=Photobacterium damselae TaxID=38293 RepID=UPI000D668548|nr:hypothetical protein [Photobacterium damselae]AWK81319.1 hypothetical protein BST98_04210 [Photobacterium damselae]